MFRAGADSNRSKNENRPREGPARRSPERSPTAVMMPPVAAMRMPMTTMPMTAIVDFRRANSSMIGGRSGAGCGKRHCIRLL